MGFETVHSTEFKSGVLPTKPPRQHSWVSQTLGMLIQASIYMFMYIWFIPQPVHHSPVPRAPWRQAQTLPPHCTHTPLRNTLLE